MLFRSVRPSQHYLMGGIKTDLDAMSTVNGLYACGECSSTGVHGANRLASNSMLECLVFGRRAAEHIKANFKPIRRPERFPDNSTAKCGTEIKNISEKISVLRDIVTKYAGPVRTPSGMAKGQETVNKLIEEVANSDICTELGFKYYNMLSCAKMIFDGAVARKESIGAHYVVED